MLFRDQQQQNEQKKKNMKRAFLIGLTAVGGGAILGMLLKIDKRRCYQKFHCPLNNQKTSQHYSLASFRIFMSFQFTLLSYEKLDLSVELPKKNFGMRRVSLPSQSFVFPSKFCFLLKNSIFVRSFVFQ